MSTTPSIHAPSLPPRGDLRRRVLAGEPTVGAFLNLGSLASAELVARAGPDEHVVAALAGKPQPTVADIIRSFQPSF